jgi:two-component system chemotaxis sensor kinase CheA
MDQVGELVISRSNLSQLYNEIGEMQDYLHNTVQLDPEKLKPLSDCALKLNETNATLGRISSEIQEEILNVRMLPVAHLFKRYPKFVTDQILQADKKVKFKIQGEETVLDKMILEDLSGPLLHIIRYSIDHGIETIEERRTAGKDETATLLLEAYPDSNAVVIEISDDGRGIDPLRIKEKALEQNLFPAGELADMSDSELVRLIMTPEFSTVAQANSTPGPGAGMDVVRNNIEKLNGTIDISSQVGSGTTIRINIPLVLSVVQTMAVKVGATILTVPLVNIEETARVRHEDITDSGGMKLIVHRDASLPVFNLAETLHIETEAADGTHAFVLIVNVKGLRAGLIVDGFMRPTETVVKPLADYLREKSGFSGATIMNDGTISLILDIAVLLNIIKNRLTDEEQKTMLENSLQGLAYA